MAKRAKQKQDSATDDKEPIDRYQHPRELVDYLNRIGAETLSFRRAMVKEYVKGNNYYIERTLVRIEPNGNILCSDKKHNPTAEEQKAIIEAFKKLEFPSSVAATRTAYELFVAKRGGDANRFFDLIDRRTGNVKMVQERITKADGSKVFIPWTMWSDGLWRAMEPDGLLPLWKPKKKTRPRIMVHEGCKAARYIDSLVNDPALAGQLSEHPFGSEFSKYEHWGMIGGALAPHRTEYDELRSERALEVVYVCDNDYAGNHALQEVSKHYGGSLTGIRFGNAWPEAYDFADAIPKEMFKDGKYIGPSLSDLKVWATRATEIVPPKDGKGKGTVVLKRAFKEEWVHCVTPEVFIHKNWPDQMLLPSEFNNKVKPYSDVTETNRLVMADDSTKCSVLKYDPSKPPGIYGSAAGRYINTHTPSKIVEIEGDIAPFLEFMDKFIVDDGDRIEMMRWCMTLIAHPDVKMHYGVLCISENQGVGKGTLGEKILAPLVGESNVSYPSEKEIVDSNFNYWLAHKRLAVVHEIYAGHSAKAYNSLKSIITDKTINVSKKYLADYTIENWMHVFACSNSKRALQVSSDDRRWFVPRVTETKRPKSYWTKFNKWLTEEDGLGIIKRYAQEWCEEHGAVEHGADAPDSSAKREVVEEGYSPGMTLVNNILKHIKERAVEDKNWIEQASKPAKVTGMSRKPMDFAVVDADLIKLIQEQIHQGRVSDRLERPLTIRKVAKAAGWFVHPEPLPARMTGLAHGRLICSNEAMIKMTMGQILSTLKPVDVVKIGQEQSSF